RPPRGLGRPRPQGGPTAPATRAVTVPRPRRRSPPPRFPAARAQVTPAASFLLRTAASRDGRATSGRCLTGGPRARGEPALGRCRRAGPDVPPREGYPAMPAYPLARPQG